MDMTQFVDTPLEKTSSRAFFRGLLNPLIGVERSQMSPGLRNWVKNQATRSGISRDTQNTKLTEWWKKNKDLADEYAQARPDAKPFLRPNDRMSTYQQFQEGKGAYQGRGTLQERIDAQRVKDLEYAFSGFGKDQKAMVDAQRAIQKAKAEDLGAKLFMGGGAAAGGIEGYRRDGMQGALTGAAVGAGLGLGARGIINAAKRSPEAQKMLEAARATEQEIARRHGQDLLGTATGAKLKYMGRRITDPILERGRFANLKERARFGRLGGGYLFGQGAELLAARAVQGGLLGKGGLIRGSLALDPRIGMDYRLMGHALGKGNYGQAARLGKDVVVGSGIGAGHLTLMGGMPAYMTYSEMAEDDGSSGKSFASRLGGSLGRNFGMTATMPLGMLTWAPSMALGESYGLAGQIGHAGENIGALIQKNESNLPTPEPPNSPARLAQTAALGGYQALQRNPEALARVGV